MNTPPRAMRTVRCPGCRSVYKVDRAKVPPGGGHLTCPACGRRWLVQADVDPDATDVLPRDGTSSTTSAATAVLAVRPSSGMGADTPPAAGPAPAADPARVPCPRCGYEFVPGAAAGPKKSVLVVDDQEFFRNFAVDLLAPRYRTHVAKSCDEALRTVAEVRPDLIVLDLGLDQGPDDGRRILGELGGTVPVIIMTGRSDFDAFGDDWRELERLGARDFVIKSLGLGDELPAKVARVLGS